MVTEKFVVVCVFWLFSWWTPWCIEDIGSGVLGLFGILRTTRPCTDSVSCSRTCLCGMSVQVAAL